MELNEEELSSVTMGFDSRKASLINEIKEKEGDLEKISSPEERKAIYEKLKELERKLEEITTRTNPQGRGRR